MSFMTYLLRKTFKSSDDKRDAGLTTPEDIERWDDICYGTDPKTQTMDIYRPKNAKEKLPVIVSVHGGGWTYGDKQRYQYYCMNLAQRGFVVVNFTYRLAPEFQFPASIEDTNLVFAWLVQHEDCGWYDLDRLSAVGDSAGGHMVTIYCAALSNPIYAQKLGITIPKRNNQQNIAIKSVGLNCGVYQIDLKNGGIMMKGLMKALLKSKGKDKNELDLVNPVNYILSFPRAFIMTANKDSIAGVPSQKVLVDKLKELGVEFIDKTYGTEKNPLNHVFHCDIRSEQAKICNDEETEFFKK